MKHPRFATVTILALILLGVCCQLLPALHAADAMGSMPQSMEHLILLSVSTPTTVVLLIFFIASAILLSISTLGIPLQASVEGFLRQDHPPDRLFLTPLRFALSEGLLNPKLY